MKQTKNFNISVPEIGDKPDITQVSNAIQDLEDALAGTLEIMNAEIQETALTLTSGARTTQRTKYYDGMAIKFVAPIQISPNTLTTVIVDGLSQQRLEIPYLVNAGDSVDIIYNGTKFIGAITAIQRSNAVDSTSDQTVATSLAVKTLNDNKVEKSTQVIAGNGLVGGGNLSGNLTINVASSNDSIIVDADGIKVNVADTVLSTSQTIPASANSAKLAYDKGESALQNAIVAQESANSKVAKSGDTMNGLLNANGGININGNKVYHQDFKPTPKEIGAVSSDEVYDTGGTFGKIPRVGLDGVMEVGRYIDFHFSEESSTTGDYASRISCDKNGKLIIEGPFYSEGQIDTNSNGNSGWRDFKASFQARGIAAGYGGSLSKLAEGLYENYGPGGELIHYGIGAMYGEINLYTVGHNESPVKRWIFSCTTGDFTSHGNVIAYSDIKLKKDLEVIPNALEKIQALNGYTYTRKDTGIRQTGVVAQEVQKVLPEAVTISKSEDGEETLGVAYGNMVGLLIEGIKDQQNKIESMEKRIERLERFLKEV